MSDVGVRADIDECKRIDTVDGAHFAASIRLQVCLRFDAARRLLTGFGATVTFFSGRRERVAPRDKRE